MSSGTSAVVVTMKGLVGDACSNPDLTPTAPTSSGGFDRRIELAARARHHSGGITDCPQ
jgi:hypothetical protein